MASFLPLLYALLGGVFMGTYPVPIKSKAVIEANVHPVVFQLYKSTMVFLTGFLFLIPRAIDPTLGPVSSQKQEYGELPLYIFTYWGIVSAAGWIPSGLTTIFAVPIVGVGLAVAVAAGSSSILSFLVFWLVMGEKVKTHSCGDGCTYYLAPVWLFLVVCGMVGMVLSPQFKNLPQWLGGGSQAQGSGDSSEDDMPPLLVSSANRFDEEEKKSQPNTWANAKPYSPVWFLGLSAGMMTGIFSSVQYGAVTAGKEYEENKAHCYKDPEKCPARLNQQFNDVGSWLVSFGIGAFTVTLTALLVLVCFRTIMRFVVKSEAYAEKRMSLCPSLHWKIMRKPGITAGTFWVLGNVFCTLAVVTGGNAIANAQMVASQLITSGLWGVFYYGEIQKGNAIVWGFFALLTLATMILLGLEKA